MMIKEKKSPLLIASFASLISFVSLLITLSLPQKLNQPQVLGVITPPRISNNLVPCSVIESWQKQYCSTTNISPVPTKYITPTPVASCTPSASLVANNITCKTNASLYSYSTYRCQNGSFIRVGDSTGTKCYDQNTLYQQAINRCASFCTPNPTPTTAKITPTKAPTPSPAPTGYYSDDIYRFSIPTGENQNITCKLGDLNCKIYTTVNIYSNDKVSLYNTTIYTTDKNLTFRGFDNIFTQRSTTSRIIKPYEQVIGTIVNFVPPQQIGTYYSTLYVDGKECNYDGQTTDPSKCFFHGASQLKFKIEIVK